MNGVNHAATALLIKKKWPAVPMAVALVAVQASDLLWFVFTSTAVESVAYADPVRSLRDIHFVYMPFSHALLSTVFLSVLAALFAYGLRRNSMLALAVAVGVLSHVALDLTVHMRDIALSYWDQSTKLGSGLYGIPVAALFFELAYMGVCWYVGRGSRRLLIWLIALNLIAVSLYVPPIPGPERWFDGFRELFPMLVLVQIIAGSAAVYLLHPHDHGLKTASTEAAEGVGPSP